MSNKIPKPLIKIKGKPMIETLIEAMLHHGINDITVVVGYMKEKFYYLKDKYKEVSLIENKEYESRGAISSFYAAKHLLYDNYLITEGNFFINDFSILDPNVENTTYLYQKTTPHNNIWGFVFKKGSNEIDRKSTRLNSSHVRISYAVFCLKKKIKTKKNVIYRNS